MSVAEQKWRANSDKVAFARAFPGLLQAWGDAVGKNIREVLCVEGGEKAIEVILFDDDTFLIGGGAAPAEILRVIAALRPKLGERYNEGYAQLDELAAADAELTRIARMENILGAIRNNIPRIPELYEKIPRLLEELRAAPPPTCAPNQE